MLVLGVHLDESCELQLGDGTTAVVTLVSILHPQGRRPHVRLGFEAPRHVQIASPTTLRKRAAGGYRPDVGPPITAETPLPRGGSGQSGLGNRKGTKNELYRRWANDGMD